MNGRMNGEKKEQLMQKHRKGESERKKRGERPKKN